MLYCRNRRQRLRTPLIRTLIVEGVWLSLLTLSSPVTIKVLLFVNVLTATNYRHHVSVPLTPDKLRQLKAINRRKEIPRTSQKDEAV